MQVCENNDIEVLCLTADMAITTSIQLPISYFTNFISTHFSMGLILFSQSKHFNQFLEMCKTVSTLYH